MTRSYWVQRPVRPRRDVLVVGAGITGAAAAYWLRKQAPELDVLVLERENPGAGASGRREAGPSRESGACACSTMR